MFLQVVIDAVRILLIILAVVTLVITPRLLVDSADEGQQARFWGSTAMLVAVVVGMVQGFGEPMRWSFPVVIVGVLSITYGSFHMLRRESPPR